ncbi:dipeptidyl aminopeptidase/acylaminoacyl peptidase [Chiayiivirga flava]|uniref:Dipeptidyl aminopeptidase/acylaminoacyl peptidase n=2 Tax=Chiayiivirga flava TaxID=659595 RepID=A0A7W8G0S8_9GAMM|nr:S9 family peptidase [Chiayiivirga flava]MBB5209797.1 dipeptidyl aminopeptidase/acylaminoacyl peptidase [Chiayiivirga flava]
MRRTALALALVAAAVAAHAAPRGMTATDLVSFDRVSAPTLSPDGKRVVFTLREADLDANKAAIALWLTDIDGKTAPRRLTASGSSANSAQFSPDGRALFFLSSRSGSMQVWRLDLSGGEAQQVTHYALDVGGFKLAPDGKSIAFSLEVFTDCADLGCTSKRLEEASAKRSSGVLYDSLFVRHWDTWMDGRRSQLFVSALDATHRAAAAPVRVSRGIEGDVPSKPFGDAGEYAWAPDGKSLVFSARVAGKGEPWSTNFDLYRSDVAGSAAPQNLTEDNPAWDTAPTFSADGRTLYYTAMKRPGFEADRYAIMAKTLATGATREIAPQWDRSAGALTLSHDGRTLYTAADDMGEHPLFAIDIASGEATRVVGGGAIEGFDVGRDIVVFARSTLTAPANLFRAQSGGSQETPLATFNNARLAEVRFGEYEQFEFAGANGDTVHGYVVKPWNYSAGNTYPVAFIIHGGPQGSMGNSFHYRWNPQSYAGAGYAAVFIDFHGSTGYGQAFTDAISGDWGGKPLEDLQKGWAAALAKYDFLDGDRACALGASYGGYMINWIAGNWNDPWKCLVNHDGVFDTRSMGYVTEELWFTEWENGGTPYEQPANYEKWNPVNHVAKWRVPMLVVQGEKDYRVPVDQGLSTFTALQRRGIESQLLYFPDENHWVLRPQNSVHWHATVIGWLDRHTKVGE